MVEQGTTKKKRTRSPSYPSIGLGAAIDRADAVWEKERGNYVPVPAILKDWGYTTGSGYGMVILAALLKFGLLEDSGVGSAREARVTELAKSIILDRREDSPDRLAAIQEAAMKPPIHAELWAKYSGDLPSDASLTFYLERDRNFLDTAAADFIKNFKATLVFAKFNESDIISEGVEDKAPEKKPSLFPSLFDLAPKPLGEAKNRMEVRTEQATEQTTDPRVIQLPLTGGKWAALQASFPMSEDDWRQLHLVLDAMKPGLVTDDKTVTQA